MKKLEPGMLCRTVGAMNPENNGKIVTLIKFVGKPDDNNWSGSDWWEVDSPQLVSSLTEGDMYVYFAPEQNLVPIDFDHQPADEQWQADFKRMLLGGQKAKEKPLDRSGARG